MFRNKLLDKVEHPVAEFEIMQKKYGNFEMRTYSNCTK